MDSSQTILFRIGVATSSAPKSSLPSGLMDRTESASGGGFAPGLMDSTESASGGGLPPGLISSTTEKLGKGWCYSMPEPRTKCDAPPPGHWTTYGYPCHYCP